MDMTEIKEKITSVTDKITKDKNLTEQFKKDPVKAVESALGVDLPDDVVKKIVEGVKAKISGDKISGAVDSIKKLF
jgi:signal recognition particle GTPase